MKRDQRGKGSSVAGDLKLSPEEQLKGRRQMIPRERRCRPMQRGTLAVGKHVGGFCEGEGTEGAGWLSGWGVMVINEKATMNTTAAV